MIHLQFLKMQRKSSFLKMQRRALGIFQICWRIVLYKSISNESGQLGLSLCMLRKKKDLEFSSEGLFLIIISKIFSLLGSMPTEIIL